ncbi:bifunctional aspartate transaminase/aspartate 4-decarboxylase [Alicyclobacillus vulcanalis]|uniref:Aminotransferase n=1 Tax=Alicyclobacillus vulcanalis TaxID=252246 RepID=A0A1N7M4P7_9BACL|nr:bifunctional aspartate transaminase/aspartate 4-decarboxylase [Alicyclobacillus vulcanalis]SIS81080.1 aspartate 4-decarboxylase [Alicyclobacillus vulcanalis]
MDHAKGEPEALRLPHDARSRRELERTYEDESPFELRNQLLSLAKRHDEQRARVMLDAGRGNPNWIAARPREAFWFLGQFALEEARRVWHDGDLAGMPHPDGVMERFEAHARRHEQDPGCAALRECLEAAAKRGMDREAMLAEWVDGVIGDNYPTPDRILPGVERVMAHYLAEELCGGRMDPSAWQLFATEGATAAMCYVFDSLAANHLLPKGAKMAVMVPIFPPYIEIPALERYQFDVIEIRATGRSETGTPTWQYPLDELRKLADPSVKALFLVNPSNPPSVALSEETLDALVDVVRNHNPELMIITDDVYGTFVDGFRSLATELPENTLLVYSLSKHFGVTGWRLGVVALQRENVFDRRLQAMDQEVRAQLGARYRILSPQPDQLPFIDRMVADSRQVALNHTAGLSTPQQVQMSLFALFAMTDRGQQYKAQVRAICHRRMRKLYEALGLPVPELPCGAAYYTELDIQDLARRRYGDQFVAFLEENYEPVDILFRLAESSGMVLLNGGGFHAPPWSVRISLANLPDGAYETIGREIIAALDAYAGDWKRAGG